MTERAGPRRLALLSASPDELQPLASRLALRPLQLAHGTALGTLELGGVVVDLVAVGTGEVLAFQGLQAVLRERAPEAVVLVGIGGGLAPGVERGDAVVAQWVAGEAGRVQLDRPLHDALVAMLRRTGVRVHSGGLYTSGRRVVSTRDEKALLATTSHALCVDMEAMAIAAGCASAETPLGVTRFISDDWQDELPSSLNDCFDPLLGFDEAALASSFAADPSKGERLVEFAQLAIRHLTGCATALLMALTLRAERPASASDAPPAPKAS